MAIKLPERNYFRFSELMSRWQCNEDDIRYLIVNRKLRPSYFIDHTFKLEELVKHESGGVVRVPVDSDMEFHPRGLFYLHFPGQRAAFDCTFGAVSENRERPNFVGEWKDFFVLSEELTLAQVLEFGVVTLEELAKVERDLASQGERDSSSKVLTNRERDTLLTIIAVLCKEAGHDYTKHAKTAGLIRDTAAEMDVSIGETTIENHLKKIPDALAGRMK